MDKPMLGSGDAANVDDGRAGTLRIEFHGPQPHRRGATRLAVDEVCIWRKGVIQVYVLVGE